MPYYEREMLTKLKQGFFSGDDVTKIAKALLGKSLVTNVNGEICKSTIVETEAYSHIEKGCHAYNNRRTKRTEVMFGEPGHAYVYLCYGIHRLFNIVTNKKDVAEAVLIRAVEPLDGMKLLQSRSGAKSNKRLLAGPGKLSKGLGIGMEHNGISLCGDILWLENGMNVEGDKIISAPRIGIDYAGEDSLLPWRYYIKDNKHVSKY